MTQRDQNVKQRGCSGKTGHAWVGQAQLFHYTADALGLILRHLERLKLRNLCAGELGPFG